MYVIRDTFTIHLSILMNFIALPSQAQSPNQSKIRFLIPAVMATSAATHTPCKNGDARNAESQSRRQIFPLLGGAQAGRMRGKRPTAVGGPAGGTRVDLSRPRSTPCPPALSGNRLSL